MIVRKGTKDDFKRLEWGWNKDYPTKEMFINRMKNGIHEFWVVESRELFELLGEFHIVLESPDKDEADGKSRAYLCVFRIHPSYRGMGLGKKLKEKVFSRVEELGKVELTIGVKKESPKIRSMYHRWGFTKLIKKKYIDHHNINYYGEYSRLDIPIELYLKKG